MKRRRFIKTAVGAGSLLVLPVGLKAFGKTVNSPLRFGVCADVHKDIMFDADDRLQAFIDKASERNLDFIIQMGDFCRPADGNRKFLSVWNSYQRNHYHVVGNHDMDGGFSRKDVTRFWGIQKTYYSFNSGGFHVVVLDGNDKNHSKHRAAGYARFVGQKQLRWLKKDLKATALPCLIFTHQTLENNDDGIENREEIRTLFENENRAAGFGKIVACFSGHHHTDYTTKINGIYYVQINSMSFRWLGEKCQIIRYSKEIDRKYPLIKFTVPYKSSLYAFIEVNDENMKIEGVTSSFVGPSPKDKNCPKHSENKRIVPFIENRNLNL